MAVVLGLGTNVGDRLGCLRQALNMLRARPDCKVRHISPVYLSDALLPEQAPLAWDRPYLNMALTVTTTLSPLELLAVLKQVEGTMRYDAGLSSKQERWAPRKMDIDILAWDELWLATPTLTIPHPALLQRPFALWPLADLAPFWRYPAPGALQGKTAAELVAAWGSRFSGKAPHRTRQLPHAIDPPRLVGILNITPDSFSDGGRYIQPQRALAQALTLVAEGAEILDIGAESTAPGAVPLSAEQEWQRLQPVLALIRQAQDDFVIPPVLSIDTRHPEVAQRVLAVADQPHWINDVTGLDHPRMRALLAAYPGVMCVVMHHLCVPENRAQRLPLCHDVVATVLRWARQRLALLERAGIAAQRVILDPGIGFGKSAEQSLTVLARIRDFKPLPVRLLVGHSRKSFLASLTGSMGQARDIDTTACSLFLAQHQIDFLRVHQVGMHARALRIQAALKQAEV